MNYWLNYTMLVAERIDYTVYNYLSDDWKTKIPTHTYITYDYNYNIIIYVDNCYVCFYTKSVIIIIIICKAALTSYNVNHTLMIHSL